MPRVGRLHVPGACYHVMGRGLDGRYIFRTDEDKQAFVSRLQESIEKAGAQCLGWAMMSNHYHLLIRVGEQPLAKLMSPLLGGYGANYNKRHKRAGYVFQNRFKSILCDEDSYLLELIRYIHLNPVRAGLVMTINGLDDYQWTGHSTLLDRYKNSWQTTDEVLAHFSTHRKAAQSLYRSHLIQGLHGLDQNHLLGGGLIRSYGGWDAIHAMRKAHEHYIGDERILGDTSFVERVLKLDDLRLKQSAQVELEGWDVSWLMEKVCTFCDVEIDQLQRKARTNSVSDAKALFCYFSWNNLGESMTDIANVLSISQPAVSKWVNRGVDLCAERGIEFETICT